jgi:hypothetical protein
MVIDTALSTYILWGRIRRSKVSKHQQPSTQRGAHTLCWKSLSAVKSASVNGHQRSTEHVPTVGEHQVQRDQRVSTVIDTARNTYKLLGIIGCSKVSESRQSSTPHRTHTSCWGSSVQRGQRALTVIDGPRGTYFLLGMGMIECSKISER